jgi:hypothetical protein
MDVKLEDINDRFKSGNSIPVERAYLKREEWELIYVILKSLAYPGVKQSPNVVDLGAGLRFVFNLPDQPVRDK